MKWPALRRKARPLRSVLGATVQQRYEEATGQIFTEHIVPMQTSSDEGWTKQEPVIPRPSYASQDSRTVKRSRTEQVKPTSSGVRRGAKPLTDTVIEFLVRNLEQLTTEALECLPRPIVQRVWQEASTRCSISFSTWQMFSSLLYQEDNATLDLFRYHQRLKSPKSRLCTYTLPLTSRSFDFISSLSITTGFTIPELSKLSRMPNLGVLEVISRGVSGLDTYDRPFPVIGDGLVRAWQRAVVDDGAFPILRILRMWNFTDITDLSLQYVTEFPSLAVYEASSHGFSRSTDAAARSLGWGVTKNTDSLLLLEAACVERWKLMQESLGLKARFVRWPVATELPDSTRISRPSRPDAMKIVTQLEHTFPDETCNGESSKESQNKPIPDQGSVVKPESCKKNIKRPYLPSQDQDEFLARSSPKSLDCRTAKAFARIGELRNDRDLAAAGIDTTSPVVVEKELIPPLPFVSLQLGRSEYTKSHLGSTWDPRSKSLIFTRVKYPSTSAVKDDTHEKKPQAKEKNAPRTLRHGKKQKLENVLESFLAG
ncbi:hypothetical protein BP5796_10483 [Coleophoma crateriformis]|uniref:Uncharacterized protein n=1 Tax=Coleophoma crateriformis TaxID=565419 RepID=A0A3D8QQJ5_9HELO|nr:hypothetical protein BP5796_10483 [Coleophoma crateriformis]